MKSRPRPCQRDIISLDTFLDSFQFCDGKNMRNVDRVHKRVYVCAGWVVKFLTFKPRTANHPAQFTQLWPDWLRYLACRS